MCVCRGGGGETSVVIGCVGGEGGVVVEVEVEVEVDGMRWSEMEWVMGRASVWVAVSRGGRD